MDKKEFIDFYFEKLRQVSEIQENFEDTRQKINKFKANGSSATTFVKEIKPKFITLTLLLILSITVVVWLLSTLVVRILGINEGISFNIFVELMGALFTAFVLEFIWVRNIKMLESISEQTKELQEITDRLEENANLYSTAIFETYQQMTRVGDKLIHEDQFNPSDIETFEKILRNLSESRDTYYKSFDILMPKLDQIIRKNNSYDK